MNAGGVAWAAGGYLAGTFPSTWIVARAKHARGLLAAAGRAAGETDAHILVARHLGVRWAILAGTLDVLKGFGLVLAARHWGHLDPAWLALTGTSVVVGHAFPFYARQMAGRGLAAASGVLLVLLPVEMTVAGALIVLGGIVRRTGLATTLGMAGVPVVAAMEGQPGEFVAMGAAILAILLARRLEGVEDVIRSGVSPGRAMLYRCVFDSSGPPAGRGVWDRGEDELPHT